MDNQFSKVVEAVQELGYNKADDTLPIANRFQDVREVTNLVRYTTYQVDNMAAVIHEDIAEGQAAAAMLSAGASKLGRSVAALEKLAGLSNG